MQGITRERRPNGNTKCPAGHEYTSAEFERQARSRSHLPETIPESDQPLITADKDTIYADGVPVETGNQTFNGVPVEYQDRLDPHPVHQGVVVEYKQSLMEPDPFEELEKKLAGIQNSWADSLRMVVHICRRECRLYRKQLVEQQSVMSGLREELIERLRLSELKHVETLEYLKRLDNRYAGTDNENVKDDSHGCESEMPTVPSEDEPPRED